jgi:hypothetical protein
MNTTLVHYSGWNNCLRFASSDFGCNAEFFTNERMMEVESLDPLVTLKPEESITHQEDWFLFRGVTVSQTEEEIETALKPLLERSAIVKEM